MSSSVGLDPVYAVGGIGGSGTRLVAMLLSALGFSLGQPLNAEMDNLFFTLLFKRPEILNMQQDEFSACINLFLDSLYGRQPGMDFMDVIHKAAQSHPVKWSDTVCSHVFQSLVDKPEAIHSNARTGWKEPNTHIIIDRLYEAVPHLKYIHVMRHGLDMAYSNNKRQALLWGKHLLNTEEQVQAADPPYLLRYWCAVHRKMAAFSRQWASERPVFWLNYDLLLADPTPILQAFLDFLGVDATASTIKSLEQLINISSSSGKYILQNLSIFPVADLAYVESLGFTINKQLHLP